MKKIISILTVLALTLSFAVSSFASEFVPSISYKDGPELLSASLEGEDVFDCLVITTIKKAENKTTDITDEERNLLLSVYEKLTSGEMKLPLKNDYIIRELLDLSFMYEACRNNSAHGEKENALKQNGANLTVSFDLGIAQDENLKVLVYVNGEWKSVKTTTINADGSVTVEFEEICPVAFCIEKEAEAVTPDNNVGLIITLVTAVVSAVAASIILAIKLLIFKR